MWVEVKARGQRAKLVLHDQSGLNSALRRLGVRVSRAKSCHPQGLDRRSLPRWAIRFAAYLSFARAVISYQVGGQGGRFSGMTRSTFPQAVATPSYRSGAEFYVVSTRDATRLDAEKQTLHAHATINPRRLLMLDLRPQDSVDP